MSLAILMSAILAAQASGAAPLPVPASEEEILVVAQRMQMLDVDMKVPRRRGVLVLERCRVKQTTGYAQLDAIPCQAAQDCMLTPPRTRKLLGECVEQRAQAQLNATVAAWREAGHAPR